VCEGRGDVASEVRTERGLGLDGASARQSPRGRWCPGPVRGAGHGRQRSGSRAGRSSVARRARRRRVRGGAGWSWARGSRASWC